MSAVPNVAAVEIVAKQKGCMMCDLAVAILEEIEPEFEPGWLRWQVVDVASREGVARQAELARLCGRLPPVPSIVINEAIAFDHIPDMESLANAVRGVIEQTWAGEKLAGRTSQHTVEGKLKKEAGDDRG